MSRQQIAHFRAAQIHGAVLCPGAYWSPQSGIFRHGHGATPLIKHSCRRNLAGNNAHLKYKLDGLPFPPLAGLEYMAIRKHGGNTRKRERPTTAPSPRNNYKRADAWPRRFALHKKDIFLCVSLFNQAFKIFNKPH